MKILVATLLMLFLTIPALAQDELLDPGITPDSLLYPLDLLFDDINLAVTFSEESKIDKQFQIAEERLAEAQLMFQENKTFAAERALFEHTSLMERVTLRTKDNATDMLKAQLQLEERLRIHNEKIEGACLDLDVECQGLFNGTMNQTRNMTNLLTQDKNRVMAEIDNSDVVEEEIKSELGIANSANGAKKAQ